MDCRLLIYDKEGSSLRFCIVDPVTSKYSYWFQFVESASTTIVDKELLNLVDALQSLDNEWFIGYLCDGIPTLRRDQFLEVFKSEHPEFYV